MKVTSRHHLRNDEVRQLKRHVSESTGVEIDGDHFERVEFESDVSSLVLVDGAANVAVFDGEYFLTVRGANQYTPSRRLVTVDAGAVSFVSNGADVMRPGIVEADPEIEPGDLVLVNEETHGKVLAIGRATTSGHDMVGESGKVVESVHYVGDELFQFVP